MAWIASSSPSDGSTAMRALIEYTTPEALERDPPSVDADVLGTAFGWGVVQKRSQAQRVQRRDATGRERL